MPSGVGRAMATDRQRRCRGCGRTDADLAGLRDHDGMPACWFAGEDWCSVCEGPMVAVHAETHESAEARRRLGADQEAVN